MKQWQIFLMLGLFVLVLSSFNSAEGASPVSITTDKSSGDILEGDFIVFTLTLDNSDTRYRNMEVYMVANWSSDIAWNSTFVDSNYDELDSNLIRMGKGELATINIMIICEGLCSAGDTNELRIYGLTDPRFYLTDYGEGEDPGNHTDTCGSADCKNDTTPASSSINITNIISLNLNARTGYTSVIACDVVASIGDNVFTPGDTYLWGYTLTNTGWLSDSYRFDVDVTSKDGQDVWYWEVAAGILDGKVLTGQSDSSSSAVHSIEASMSITPATNATSGVYNVELTVTSAGGGADAGCNFDVVIPENETEEETTGDPANETAEEETTGAPANETAEEETISISANVPMKVEYYEPQYIEFLNETKIVILEREVLVTQTDSQVNWVSMDIATGENFTFTFIADNLVNGTEYSFSYEIISVKHGSALENASHIFIANNTDEYSYNLEGQFPNGDWYYNCTRVQAVVSFVKNPNSNNGTLEELASFSTNSFYSSGYKGEICNPPINDPGFEIPSVSVISALISIGLIAIFRRK